MKKVRITVNKGVSGKAFKIFNSPESLYVWLNDPELQQDDELDVSLGNVVYLKKGEFMEAEWCGCEFLYEDNKLQFRADYIRIGKLISSPTSFLKGKNIVGIQDGWVLDDTISFKSGTDGLTKTMKLTSRSKHKFDLDELFAARIAYDEMEEELQEDSKEVILN
jgi:hypothetical protein